MGCLSVSVCVCVMYRWTPHVRYLLSDPGCAVNRRVHQTQFATQLAIRCRHSRLRVLPSIREQQAHCSSLVQRLLRIQHFYLIHLLLICFLVCRSSSVNGGPPVNSRIWYSLCELGFVSLAPRRAPLPEQKWQRDLPEVLCADAEWLERFGDFPLFAIIEHPGMNDLFDLFPHPSAIIHHLFCLFVLIASRACAALETRDLFGGQWTRARASASDRV